VRHSVDDQLAHSFERVLHLLAACHAVAKLNPFAQIIHQERLRAANLLRERPADVLAREHIAHLAAGEARRRDVCPAQELLRVAAKEQNARVGRHQGLIAPRQAAALEQHLLRRDAAHTAQSCRISLRLLPIQISPARVAGGFGLKGDIAPL